MARTIYTRYKGEGIVWSLTTQSKENSDWPPWSERYVWFNSAFKGFWGNDPRYISTMRFETLDAALLWLMEEK